MRSSERLRVALVSIFATWIFFYQYIPPTKKVHFWSDIEGYHWPLLNTTFKALQEGRFPLWDWFIYSGVPFAGNLQAGVFYPPNWLLIPMNAGRGGILYKTVELLYIAHVWLGFFLAYLWLRHRSKNWLASVLGAGTFAYSGYLLSMSAHLGMSCGFAWSPLAFWGIDQAGRTGQLKYLWKVAVASALFLLAGYPSLWLVFCMLAAAYALAVPGRLRVLPGTVVALGLSALLCAVQLLPAMEASALKMPEKVYGGAMDSNTFWSPLLPNYFDQNRLTWGPDIAAGPYLYLGATFLFAFVWLVARGRVRLLAPPLAVLIAGLAILQNPWGVLENIFDRLPMITDVLRGWSALCCFALVGASITASGVDDFLESQQRTMKAANVMRLWMAASIVCCLWLIHISRRGSPEFVAGFASAMYSAATLGIVICGLYLFRSAPSRVALFLLATVFVEFKVFGTVRRFNAVGDDTDAFYKTDARIGGPDFGGLDLTVYQELLKHPEYRIALINGPLATDFRHYGLRTPHGFDPFLPKAYKEVVEEHVKFHTNRLFDAGPGDEALFRRLGVGFVMVRHESPAETSLLANPIYKRIDPGTSYFTVFRIVNAQPSWRFEGSVERRSWTPEIRRFRVQADRASKFALLENLFPGWHARLDDKEVQINTYDRTFQSIDVPPGVHEIEFRYRPTSMLIGAAVSLCSLLLVVWVARRPVTASMEQPVSRAAA